MRDDDDKIIVTLGFLLFLAIVSIGVITFTPNLPRQGYFYVEYTDYGYAVAMDDPGGSSARITKYMTLEEAKKACD